MFYTVEDKNIGKRWVLTPTENNGVKVEYFEYFSFSNIWKQVGGYFIYSKEYVKEEFGIIID